MILLIEFYKLLKGLIFFRSFKISLSNDFTIPLRILKKSNVFFPHPIGIVIGTRVEIGKNCTIYQNTTIGTKDFKEVSKAVYPKIGDNVIIFPNSVIVGDIHIGNNSIIGANSFVNCNVPANTIYAGNPAKLISEIH